MSEPTISVNINLDNTPELTERLVMMRHGLVGGGFSESHAAEMVYAVLRKALDTGNTTVSLGVMDDRKAFLDEARKDITDYVITEVSKFLSRWDENTIR